MMNDTDFNSLTVVADRAAALALSLTLKGGSPRLFLFADSPDGTKNSQQDRNYFDQNKPNGNRITYYRRTPRTGVELEGLEYPQSTSQDALGYVAVHDVLVCDPFGVLPPSGCSTSKAYQDQDPYEVAILADNADPEGARHAAFAPNDIGGTHTNKITVPTDLDWRTGSLPEFVEVVPPSAAQCIC